MTNTNHKIENFFGCFLITTFFSFWVFLITAGISVWFFDYSLVDNPFLFYAGLCGLVGVILAFTDKYWEIKSPQQSIDDVRESN